MLHVIKRALFTLLALGMLSLFADTIYFNNGAVLKGTITEQNSNTITIIVDGVNTTYGMRDVNRIENSHVSPPPPPPPPAQQSKPTAIASGTTLHLITTESISTRSHKEGHQFKMQLESDLYVNSSLVAKRGSEVYAVISSSKQAGRLAGNSSLHVTLRALIIEGKRVPIQSQSLNILTQHNQVRNTASQVGRAAAIGALVDGKSGARTGAKVGTGAAILTRGQAAGVPAGTLLDFILTSNVNL
ncbi:MAG: hypothetical protein U9N52_11790 [Campylobacterota bacterium]|nr:hypothetical protein [Campylobacterota bacterium]